MTSIVKLSLSAPVSQNPCSKGMIRARILICRQALNDAWENRPTVEIIEAVALWQLCSTKSGAEVIAMDRTRKDRSLVAWMLYACVLFNVFVCGIGHGQISGLTLNGVGGQFCSTSNDGVADVGGDPGTQSESSSWASNFSCPLCSSITLSLVFQFSLAWLVRTNHAQRKPVESGSKAPPRYSWPSANPRASPLF
jgi:hypothetical protein